MKPTVPGRQKAVLLFVFFAAAITLPYVVAAVAGGETHVFGGFLLNPLDGNSYLAKMQQGAGGTWRFTLPFTSQPGEGAYIFLFYLFLGHVCRWTGLPLLWMFHLVRVMAALGLLFSLRKFYDFIFVDQKTAWRAFVLSTVGSGMGWLVFASGQMLSDFWVAEAYPFLASYANPHFPLGLTLMVWILMLGHQRGTRGQADGPLSDHEVIPQTARGFSNNAGQPPAQGALRDGVKTAALALVLGIVMPFGVVIVGMILFGLAVLELFHKRRVNWLPVLGVFVLGGAMILYQVWVTQADPVFFSWNQQNVTPAPPWWDILLAFSPALLLAVVGLAASVRRLSGDRVMILAVWVVGAVVLISMPVSLQRRFLLGFYIPVAGLAAAGVSWLEQRGRFSGRRIFTVLWVLSLPTNVVLLMAGIFGAFGLSPMIYVSRAEDQAMRWLAEQPGECLVLASPQMGMFLPGHSGCRVMYGHPFETVNAAQEEMRVTSFYAGEMQSAAAAQYLQENQVDYIYYGSREANLGKPLILADLYPVYVSEEVIIFGVDTP